MTPQAGCLQTSTLYLETESLLHQPQPGHFPVIGLWERVLNAQLLACVLKEIIAGVTQVLEHLLLLVYGH